MIEIVEVESPAKGVVGIEIDVDGKKYFISKDQSRWNGIRLGTFPRPGIGDPAWRKDVVVYRSDREDLAASEEIDDLF